MLGMLMGTLRQFQRESQFKSEQVRDIGDLYSMSEGPPKSCINSAILFILLKCIIFT